MKRVIGPFLGARGPGKVRIVIGLPNSDYSLLRCNVIDSQGNFHHESTKTSPTFREFKTFIFDIENLKRNQKYLYIIKDDDGPINLGEGLDWGDCYFYGSSEFEEQDYFILLSCNNPFETGKSTGEPWAMWEHLEEGTREDKNLKLLLFGGDQVYCDELEREKKKGKNGQGFIKKIEAAIITDKKSNNDNRKHKVLNELRNAFIQQYSKYWEHHSLRKIHARVPSLTMWDDHDITDGWGSRLDSFEYKEIKTSWKLYFEIAKETFEAYQAVRNPMPLTKNGYTNFLDIGNIRFYLMDFRSERNSRKNQLWSNESHGRFMESLSSIPQNIIKIFFLSPVIALRTNFEDDKRLSWIAKNLFALRKWQNSNLSCAVKLKCMSRINTILFGLLFLFLLILLPCWIFFSEEHLWQGEIAIIMGIAVGFLAITAFFMFPTMAYFLLAILPKIPELPDIADDIDDSLTSEANRGTFIKILKKMFSLRNAGKYVAILSGDIHVGGLSEFINTREGNTTSIPQIVSSPVGHEPMPKVIEGLTTTTSEMKMWQKNGDICYGKNLFYMSKRNYARIYPLYLDRNKKRKPILFYFEGHTEPMALHDSTLPISE